MRDWKGIGCALMFVVYAALIVLFAFCTKPKTNKPKQTETAFSNSTSSKPDKEIKQIVITSTTDSVFHYSTMCSKLGKSPELSNEYVERLSGKWMCPECGMKEAMFYINREEYMKTLHDMDSID